MPSENAAILIKQKFDSFEEFAKLAVDWNADFRQLDAERFKSDMFQAKIGALLISSAKLGCHVEQRGETPSGMRSFAIPEAGSSEMRWFGEIVDADVLLSFPAHGEIDVFSRPGLSVLTFSVPEELLESFLVRKGVHELWKSIGITETVYLGSRALLDELRQLLRIAPIIAPLGNQNRALINEFQEQILSALVQVIDKRKSRSTIYREQRQHTLDRVFDYANAHADSPIRIADLCAISEIPERSLRYLFNKELGLSPKAYLTGQRLYGAHRELWCSDSESTRISDVANHWGFWHMGQFAADYRRLFGELPSETLKRSH